MPNYPQYHNPFSILLDSYATTPKGIGAATFPFGHRLHPSIAEIVAAFTPFLHSPAGIAPIETIWAQPPVETHAQHGRWWYLKSALEFAPHTTGVYIIWRAGDHKVVRLGQGNIATRLREHSCDRSVLAHGVLMATWSPLQSWLCDGAERYLADRYKPLVGSRFPDCAPIMIRLPE
jgi:hypothetical protein